MQSATLVLAAEPVRWAALDEPAEWQGFSRKLAGSEGWWESYLAIEGMYCPGCSLTVEEALLGSPGVRSVQVNGATATARVVWSPSPGKPSEWFKALQRAGYGALPAADLLSAVPRLRAQRLLLWRWLVAGFCMMQVMMYATPAYVAQPGEITPDIQALLRWASWILTLPVLLFSCRPFFESAWRDLRHGRMGMDVPVALGLAIAFGASTAATFDPSGPMGGDVWYDSISMFVFFLLSGRLLEQRLRHKTAGSLEALARRMPETVERQSADGGFGRVPVRQLAIGDRIRVLPGEVFPADGTVVAGETRVDEALLTGESHALSRGEGQPVVAGSHNLTGMVVVHVERTGEQTRFAGIVAMMERASVEKPQLAQLADRIAGPFLLGVLIASAAAAAWWWPAGPAQALSVAVAVLIVTCPCALSLATPAATLAAAGGLARRGVLVRRLQALETCAGIDTVVFDKTGTLTEQRVSVVRSHCRPGTGTAEALGLAAALASHSLHPASRAIVAAAGAAGWNASEVQETSGGGVSGRVSRDSGWQPRNLKLGSAAFCGDSSMKGSATSQVHLADEDGWLASFELEEALRPGAVPAVGALRRLKLRLQLLSGDQTRAVRRIARLAGINASWGNQSPADKLEHVRQLQQGGHRIAMVGDGINDGPVLARADVSVAMGHAVPLAQAQADFVVLGGQLTAVASLLLHARRTRMIVRQNLAWAAGYNAVCVPLAVMGWMPPWLAGLGMAASSLLVVVNSARLARVS
ncbi:heavy metal translocating P-type ATPase [Caenimonas soli]|uniref:heavy metal translocating P-type ATPase n=1 Tax=Caenimonas soli TaxID=2735555 RepID=UPI001554AA32|nr:cation-translocating P-type ATPase [Caenimonas soli]NPC56991.1 cation-translocating P-type ATPase [Caenimonas soli]